ncbi:hypothetical protein E4631_07705 [Hymenobacter sp. UV11]|uniref:energy transducer TonB n=1 Tax=Hymenobacter sp. UV11 TaxID=1849735 RepID=UPI001061A981|nr:energy transducer TonB [Hymenobacter sp. UV11]TDN36150.1 hypothetical protein A8B98_09415 [Hymenobacter sp. UV11]TFZ66847.1 hypothetical protein E4631_07705 [Hymenobacter sp. UV11]
MLPANPLLNATAPAGPHLPVALLRQYAAGTLASAAQHRVETHTLACARCADILEGLLQTPATTTDQALAQLQQRLRQRVQQQAPARLAQRPRRHHWLAPQLAIAAALLLAMLAAGWWAWQQRQHTALPAARVAPPRPAPAPTPPLPADAPLPAAEVADAPTAAATRLPELAATTPPKRRAATAPVAAGRTTTNHQRTTSPAVSQPVTVASAPAAATTDSAVKTLSEVAVALTPPSPAQAREATDRLRAAMPPPPALAASPTGGYAALREYLKKGAAEFEPEMRDGPRRTGRVLVRLRIGAGGKLEQAEAVRKLRADYDAEAIRLLQEGPTWAPGISGGRRAAQTIDVPVEFE